MSKPISRRGLLTATGAAAVTGAAGLAYTAQADPADSAGFTWKKRWAPSPNSAKLAAFEGVEDDRANSHPGGHPHIFVRDNAYYFHIHKQDVDTHPDRQRQEVKGMRSPAGGKFLSINPDSTWRLNYQIFIPDSLKATTGFTHITQLFTPDVGPAMMVSLRKVDGKETIELKDHPQKIVVGRTDLAPLRNHWVDIQLEFLAANAPKAKVRWLIKRGSTTILDVTKNGLGTTLKNGRIRPKWGIYRSLEDNSGAIRNTSLRIRDMRAYQRLWTS